MCGEEGFPAKDSGRKDRVAVFHVYLDGGGVMLWQESDMSRFQMTHNCHLSQRKPNGDASDPPLNARFKVCFHSGEARAFGFNIDSTPKNNHQSCLSPLLNVTFEACFIKGRESPLK